MFKLIKYALLLTISICTFSNASLINIDDEQQSSARNLSSLLDLNDYILKQISECSGNQEISLVNKRFSTVAHDVPALWNKHVNFKKDTLEDGVKIYGENQFMLMLQQVFTENDLNHVSLGIFNTINNFDQLVQDRLTWIRNNAIKVVKDLNFLNIKYFEHSHVHTFDFTGQNFSGKAAILVPILKSLHLKELKLGYAQIGPQEITSMSEGLRVTKARGINFHWNALEDEGAALLGEYVKSSELEHIVLSYNKISSEGAISLIKSLENSRVNHLEFSFNKIKEEDIPKVYEEALAVKINIDRIKI